MTGLVLCLAVLLRGVVAVDESFERSRLTPNELIAKAHAASGDLRRGAYHIVESTSGSGTSGTVDMVVRGDDYVSVAHDGPFTTSVGSFQGTDWSKNENGVLAISPNDDTVTTNPYSAALDAIGSAKDASRVLGITTEEPRSIVLSLDPRPGITERRYYDAKTFLLRRIVASDETGTSSTTYEDYRLTFGRMIPYHRIFNDSHNSSPLESRVTDFRIATVSDSAFEIPKTSPVFDLGGTSQLAIPAEFTREGIVVRVTIAGRGLDFVVDSGAADTVIDAAVAKELGLSLYGTRRYAFGGEYSESKTRVDDFALGNIHAKNFALTAIPFWEMVGDKKVVGLLGSDFFSSARIRVNFRDRTLSMVSSSSPIPTGWTKLPINVDDNVPMTKAKFNGVEGHFVVDLGASETLLYAHYFAKFKPDSVSDPVGEVSTIGGKATKFREFTFSRFDVGDLAFADMNVMVPEGNAIEALTYDGLLGRSFLKNFNLIFDYPSNALYLSPQL